MKMMEVFLLKPFELEEINGEYFYTLNFEAFDHIGIYRMSVLHNKKGYFLD